MAETLNLSIQLRADGSGLVGEVRGSKEELERLAKTQDKTSESSKKMARQTGDLSSKLARMASRVAAAAAATAALAAGGMAVVIKQSIDFGDQINKISQRIGASTEALSEYSFIAERTGVQFDQLSTAWQRQTRRIAEAARGAGEAKDALLELGLSAEYLRDLKPEEQFELIADAMASIESPADRVRLAMRLWDTEGVALLQTIEGGSAALREMRREAVNAGRSLSGEAAQDMSDAKDAITNLTSAIDGAALQLGTNFAPVLTDFVNYLNDTAIPTWRKWLEDLGLLDQSYSKGLGLLQVDLQEVEERIAGVSDRLRQARDIAANETMVSARVAQQSLVIHLESELQGLEERAAALRDALAPRLDEFNARVPGTAQHAAAEAQAAASRAARDAERERQTVLAETEAQAAAAAKAAEQRADEQANALERLAAETRALSASLFPQQAAFAEYVRQVEVLQQAHEAGIPIIGGYDAALAALDDRYSALAERSTAAADALQEVGMHSGRVREQMQDTDSAAKDLGLTFSSAFEDALLKGTSVRDMLAGIAEDIARIVVRRNITEPLADAVSGFDFGSLFGGGAAPVGPEMRFASVLHGGGEVGVDGGARQVPAALFAGARRMHSGGLAGDEVPAILQRGERVIPRGESAGGGVTVNYAPVIQAIDTRSGLEFLAQHRSAVVGMVNDAYNRQGRRGPVR